MMLKISEDSKKRCKEQFSTKRIGKLIKSAVSIFELVPVEEIISKCIYNTENPLLYNVVLYLIRENCTDEKIINELKTFDFK